MITIKLTDEEARLCAGNVDGWLDRPRYCKGADEMTDATKLIERLRDYHDAMAPIPARPSLATEAVDLIEQQAARIAEYERKERSTARLLCRHGDGKLCIDGAELESAAKAEPFGWVKPAGGNYFTRSELTARRIGGMVPVYLVAPAATDNGVGRDAQLEAALRQIAEQEHIELMLDPTWAQRVAIAALSQQKAEPE